MPTTDALLEMVDHCEVVHEFEVAPGTDPFEAHRLRHVHSATAAGHWHRNVDNPEFIEGTAPGDVGLHRRAALQALQSLAQKPTILGRIPADFPVRPLLSWTPEMAEAKDPMTCGTCHLTWDDAISTALTPVPSGRCPFEYFHDEEEEEEREATGSPDTGAKPGPYYAWRRPTIDRVARFAPGEQAWAIGRNGPAVIVHTSDPDMIEMIVRALNNAS